MTHKPSDPEKLKASCMKEAWERIAENEANALMMMLEREDRKVMVIIVAAHSDPLGTTDLIHSVSANTKKSHAIQFRAGLLKRVEFLTDKIRKKS